MGTVLNSDKYFKAQRVFDMFKVSQLAVPSMIVHINSGTIIRNQKIYNFNDTNSDIIFAPKTGVWLVAISLNSDLELVYTYGIQSTEQKIIPKLPEECLHLALIEVGANDTEITNDKIYDLRQIFNFAAPSESLCQCKCAAETGITSEQIETLDNMQTQLSSLQKDIDKLKLLHDPQKVYRVKSDSGLLYDIRFKDDGTPYFTRIGCEIEEGETSSTKDYKFNYQHKRINIVNQTNKQYIQLMVKVESKNRNNENVECTLIISCPDTTIYSENYYPQYQQSEFRINNITLTKMGFNEVFELNFHNVGTHHLSMSLYDNNTHKLIDECDISYDVTFQDDGISRGVCV